ncbi:MAG: hypothetical protein JWO38_4052 [Gemmataceae bacterium]|nr:hypothetical protein [Gemmataceae bacterium]
MFRRLSYGLLGVAALALAVVPCVAQPKKERIAINDPEKVKDDPDFAIQGEYQGESGSDAKQKTGAQVVAKGGGEFDVRVLTGGLPGDGWDGKTQLKATAKRDESGAITITGPNTTGTIAAGKLTLKQGKSPEVTLAKVERKSKTLGAKPPEGAVVLFGGPGDEKNWNGGKLVELSDGKFLNMGIKSKQAFGAFKAHVEFRTPWMPNSSGQGRGNSGVYLQDRYELQVLDSFGLKGENNECGGFYTLHKPSVNMCYPPLSWQTYDIEFTPAAFDPDGKKTKNARATVFHNGVKIQDDVELKGPTGGGQEEKPTPGPFQFQNHGDPLAYNNVWVIEVK